MNNQVLSMEKWIEYYQKTLEIGTETVDTLRQKYTDYKLREEPVSYTHLQMNSSKKMFPVFWNLGGKMESD